MLKLTMKEQNRLKDFLQWNDSNGCYTDENCEIEEIQPLDNEGCIKYMFYTLYGEEELYGIDIFEMNLEELEKLLKEKNVYNKGIEKINILKENDRNITLYRKMFEERI